jgi:hypothetical protein
MTKKNNIKIEKFKLKFENYMHFLNLIRIFQVITGSIYVQ